MIILEGPDGAGKTTLAKKLLEDNVVQVSMPSPKLDKITTDLWKATRAYQLSYGENDFVAVDRFFFSELVYGTVLRNNVKFQAVDAINLFRYLQKYCFVVFCLPGVSSLKFTEYESPATIARIGDLHSGYESVAQAYMVGTKFAARYKWDMVKEGPYSYEDTVDRIKKFQGRAERW